MNSSMLDRRSMLRFTAGAALGACVGCPARPAPQPAADKTTAKPKPLVVLVADDPPLGEAIAREWRGRTEEELTVKQVTLDELSRASRLPGDAVVFPSGLIGQLVERGLIVPLENEALEDAKFNYRDIFDLIRLREMRWGGRTVAAPLGSPQLLLCYRADLFEGNEFSPPTDWSAYQQVVERFAALPSYVGLQATMEPLADGWAGQTLLARAASYAMHRDQVSPLFRLGTFEPLIDQPPYVRALEELVAAINVGRAPGLPGTNGQARGLPHGSPRKTPAEAFTALALGQCAMALAWPTAGTSGEAAANMSTKLGFASLPVSKQAYRFATGAWDDRSVEDTGPVPVLAVAGRMAAVSASSQDSRRAGGFVVWLAGRDASEHIAPHSSATTLFRQSQVASSSRWTPQLSPDESRQFAETLAATLAAPRAMPGMTLPGRPDYLAALDQAVHDALGGKPAAEALAGAAKRWREITEKLGTESQQRALTNSLGQGTP